MNDKTKRKLAMRAAVRATSDELVAGSTDERAVRHGMVAGRRMREILNLTTEVKV